MRKEAKWIKQSLRTAIIPILFAVLFLVLSIIQPMYHADMLLCDLLYTQFESKTRDIKITTIDAATGAAYGKLEGWSREKSAQPTEMLYENSETAPAVPVFDIMFIGDGDAETDKRLAKACKKAGNVICASNLVYEGQQQKTCLRHGSRQC